jgi:lysophospholipase L1-like esterase
VLDGGPFIIDSTSPYTADFTTGVSQGEHTIDAILRDGSDAEVASDTNVVIGVLGDYRGAAGDSITNGTGDTYVADNGSADGRIYSLQGGYVAKFNDLMTNSLLYPNITFNEGVPGDDSYDLAYKRIDSIKERHPEMNNVVVRIGTNDSSGTLGRPSGLNCDISTDCLNTFKGNLNVLLNKLGTTIGATNIVVTLIPPVFNYDGTPNTARNSIIQDYNTIIRKLDSKPLSGYQVGFDFFGFYFSSSPPKNLSSLFNDRLHPGPLGHVLDAYNLHNDINPGSPFALPLFLQSLSPLAYKQSLLGVGDLYYLDRSYTLTSIPPDLMGENVLWVKTKNGDKYNTSPSFLQFEISQNVTVYVAYDSRASSIPTWLSGFTKTALTIGVSDTGLGHFDVYSKSFSPGSVVLGGNMASGAVGSKTNYIVVVKKN